MSSAARELLPEREAVGRQSREPIKKIIQVLHTQELLNFPFDVMLEESVDEWVKRGVGNQKQLFYWR